MTFLDNYEGVEDRIRAFYADHPTGRITTDLINLGPEGVTFRASIYRELDPDPLPASTGHAHGLLNKAKALEFVETVSIGRALANLNYAKQGARPSREEMQAFTDEVESRNEPPRQTIAQVKATEGLTPKQLTLAKNLMSQVNNAVDIVTERLGAYRPPEVWTKHEASGDIRQKNGLIDLLIAARDEGKTKPLTVSNAPVEDDPWQLAEPPEEIRF